MVYALGLGLSLTRCETLGRLFTLDGPLVSYPSHGIVELEWGHQIDELLCLPGTVWEMPEKPITAKWERSASDVCQVCGQEDGGSRARHYVTDGNFYLCYFMIPCVLQVVL